MDGRSQPDDKLSWKYWSTGLAFLYFADAPQPRWAFTQSRPPPLVMDRNLCADGFYFGEGGVGAGKGRKGADGNFLDEDFFLGGTSGPIVVPVITQVPMGMRTALREEMRRLGADRCEWAARVSSYPFPGRIRESRVDVMSFPITP